MVLITYHELINNIALRLRSEALIARVYGSNPSVIVPNTLKIVSSMLPLLVL